MIFKPRTINEACVQEEYKENIFPKKGKPSSSKNKYHQEASKEGKKKWWGKDKKWQMKYINARFQTTTTTIVISMVTPKISVESYIQG